MALLINEYNYDFNNNQNNTNLTVRKNYVVDNNIYQKKIKNDLEGSKNEYKIKYENLLGQYSLLKEESTILNRKNNELLIKIEEMKMQNNDKDKGNNYNICYNGFIYNKKEEKNMYYEKFEHIMKENQILIKKLNNIDKKYNQPKLLYIMKIIINLFIFNYKKLMNK